MVTLKWGRLAPIGRDYGYRSHAYDTAMTAVGHHYEIEKVAVPSPKGYGWYATAPGWDGGFFASLTDAKAACNAHHAAVAEARSISIGDNVTTPEGVGVVVDAFYDNYGDTVVVKVKSRGKWDNEVAFDPDEVERV